MSDTKRILLHKNCLSFLESEDDGFYILKSGFSNPQMYIVIRDTPYTEPSIFHMTLSEVAELLGISEMVIEIGLS